MCCDNVTKNKEHKVCLTNFGIQREIKERETAREREGERVEPIA